MQPVDIQATPKEASPVSVETPKGPVRAKVIGTYLYDGGLVFVCRVTSRSGEIPCGHRMEVPAKFVWRTHRKVSPSWRNGYQPYRYLYRPIYTTYRSDI